MSQKAIRFKDTRTGYFSWLLLPQEYLFAGNLYHWRIVLIPRWLNYIDQCMERQTQSSSCSLPSSLQLLQGRNNWPPVFVYLCVHRSNVQLPPLGYNASSCSYPLHPPANAYSKSQSSPQLMDEVAILYLTFIKACDTIL